MSARDLENHVTVLWSAHDWAAAIAALPVEGPLPCRTVLVPSERVAHALRRELIRAGLAHALAGTRFVPTGAAAMAVLAAGGIACAPGEEGLRRARVLSVLRAGVPLEHFPLELLTTRPGWDQAFAATITEIEAAGLSPDDLRRHGAVQARDVAAVWQALDAAGASWTVHRIHLEAARALEDPARWPYPGAVLATADGEVTGAHARFLRAIPRVAIALRAARPLRAPYVQRIAALFGERAAETLRSSAAPRARGSERDLLVSYFLEPAEILADPARPRSAGRDGTVELEEHAGIEAEVEAAADWVAREVLQGTPLEEIAVLLPALDPLATMLAERLARLPWPDGPLPVHVAGGRSPRPCRRPRAAGASERRKRRRGAAGAALHGSRGPAPLPRGRDGPGLVARHGRRQSRIPGRRARLGRRARRGANRTWSRSSGGRRRPAMIPSRRASPGGPTSSSG